MFLTVASIGFFQRVLEQKLKKLAVDRADISLQLKKLLKAVTANGITFDWCRFC